MVTAPSNDPPEAPALFFSVVVPSRGNEGTLAALLTALAAQTFDPTRYEAILALDGVRLPASAATLAASIGARVMELDQRRGPGATRNRAAAAAKGLYLAFTEDDVIPDPDWLERAAAHLEADTQVDVLEGTTVKPDQRTAHLEPGDPPIYLPTNLFVRRALYEEVGGYHEAFFDAARGIYFREDSDLGFTLEEAGARIEREPSARVVHPRENLGYWDPLRWAQRYEMDALLAARHPRLFRERVEVQQVGPFRMRRPIPRASLAFVLALAAALGLGLLGFVDASIALVVLAAFALIPIWAKWGFDPRRLPVVMLLPFVMVAALWRGRGRARYAPMIPQPAPPPPNPAR